MQELTSDTLKFSVNLAFAPEGERERLPTKESERGCHWLPAAPKSLVFLRYRTNAGGIFIVDWVYVEEFDRSSFPRGDLRARRRLSELSDVTSADTVSPRFSPARVSNAWVSREKAIFKDAPLCAGDPLSSLLITRFRQLRRAAFPLRSGKAGSPVEVSAGPTLAVGSEGA